MSRPLTLRGAYWSVHTQRVLLALYEKELETTVSFQPLTWAQRLEPAYVQLQPFHKFPVLLDAEHTGSGGQPFVVYESMAIVTFLDDLFPHQGTALQARAGDGAHARAEQEQWLNVATGTVYPLLHALLVELIWGPALFATATDDVHVAKLAEELREPFDVMTAAFADGRQYLAGPFGVVDIALAPLLNRLVATPAGLRIVEAFPVILAWWQRIAARPSWQHVHGLDKGTATLLAPSA